MCDHEDVHEYAFHLKQSQEKNYASKSLSPHRNHAPRRILTLVVTSKKRDCLSDDCCFEGLYNFFCGSSAREICFLTLFYDYIYVQKQTGRSFDAQIRFWSHKRKMRMIFENSLSQVDSTLHEAFRKRVLLSDDSDFKILQKNSVTSHEIQFMLVCFFMIIFIF